MGRPKKEGPVMTAAERQKKSRDRKRNANEEEYKADINAKKRESRKNVNDRLSQAEKEQRTLVSNARVSIICRIIKIFIHK